MNEFDKAVGRVQIQWGRWMRWLLMGAAASTLAGIWIVPARWELWSTAVLCVIVTGVLGHGISRMDDPDVRAKIRRNVDRARGGESDAR